MHKEMLSVRSAAQLFRSSVTSAGFGTMLSSDTVIVPSSRETSESSMYRNRFLGN